MFGPVSEGMRMFRNRSDVAVVGYSENPYRAVVKVTEYLIQEGNRVTGVTPNLTEATETEIPIKRALADLPKQDIIQVWRNSRALPELAAEIKHLPWRPKLVWCQQGVVDLFFQEELEKVGIQVVMDACPYALRSYL